MPFATPKPNEQKLTSPRPLVGVTSCLDAGRRIRPGADYWYLNRRYTSALTDAGAAPVLLCPDTPVETCLTLCDGVVLSGGGDLPERLSASPVDAIERAAHLSEDAESLERIAWERALLDAFASRDRPVLGVCFGMQLMNLHFGGTLLTDLSSLEPRSIDHGGGGVSRSHALRVAADSRFFSGWTAPSAVSSSHRQAVADVAPGFRASAWAADGVVEAIERDSLIGVEWHPETDASASFVYGRWVELLRRARQP